ncbi:MAG: DUF1295 domain-containing protein, partial [Pyrinomonadaceae bacterium]|nr:DUF1295 domain-containing protein [Sphingobacteriaceae bacterium]
MESSSVVGLILISLFVCCGIMILVWFWAKKIENAGVVDIFWSYNFPVIAVILYVFADGLELRKILICSMVLIAGLRLGTHLLFRVASHLDEEEGRYKQLRKEWAPHADKRFFWFFQMQGISNVILALPFFIIAINKDAELHLLEYVAVAIWLLSVFGEGLADYQLSKFKKNPANKGKVCEVGLWR